MQFPVRLPLVTVLCSSALLLAVEGDTPMPTVTKSPKEALAKFQGLIGSWRGIGQPKRGSSRGAWREGAEWIWKFPEGQPRLEITTSGEPKLLTSGTLNYDATGRQYRFVATLPDKSQRTYEGTPDSRGRLILETPAIEGDVHRLTIAVLSDKRTTLLFQTRPAAAQYLRRVAEIGFTREGTSLAEGAGGPECIVTGGKGTTQVRHEGKSYYVCCTGCRQAFEDDPEGIIAAYEAEKKEAREAESATR